LPKTQPARAISGHSTTQVDMTTSSLTNSPSGGGPEGIAVGAGGHATLALMATKFLGAAGPVVGSNPCHVQIATWLAMTLLELPRSSSEDDPTRRRAGMAFIAGPLRLRVHDQPLRPTGLSGDAPYMKVTLDLRWEAK